MALQNRVTPFGELIATPARGTLMGNRGCLHDPARRIRRPFAVKRWIICLLEFKGRHRSVMVPGQYTELFFLDEATALAAGHRPCAECQRSRYDLFRTHWTARGRALPGADDLDDVLHAERLDGRAKRTYGERLARLPSGTMVADTDGQAYLVHGTTLVLHLGGLRLLTDPTFDPAGAEFRSGAYVLRKTHGPGLPSAALGRVDAVLLSHDHHFEGVAEVSRRFAVHTAVLFMGAARVAAVGPWHLTFTAAEGVDAARAFSNATVVPVHFEDWEHFAESRPEIDAAVAAAGLGKRLRWLPRGVETEARR